MIVFAYSTILTLIIFAAGFAQAELSASQIAGKYSGSIVTVVALDENDQPLSLGSGFFINTSGDIATNHHILEDSTRAIIKTNDGSKGTIVEVIKDSPKLDLLVARTTLQNTLPLPLGDSSTINEKDNIVIVGKPAGSDMSVLHGIITGLKQKEGPEFFHISNIISPGLSGGPVFNMSGEVIGVTKTNLMPGRNHNFAAPINSLKSLKKISVKFGPERKKKKPKKNLKSDKIVRIIDLRKNHINLFQDLEGVDFFIKNNSNYNISNIKMFFIFKNQRGEVMSYSAETFKESILPRSALRLKHNHMVRNFSYRGQVEARILDYEFDRSSSTSPADLLFK
jgi:hypothetical protein